MTYAEMTQAQRIARNEGFPVVGNEFSGERADWGTDAGSYTLLVRDVEAGQLVSITALSDFRALLGAAPLSLAA